MGELIDAARAFFEEDGWSVLPAQSGEGPLAGAAARDSDGALWLAHEGAHGRWGCLVRAREQARQLIFYSIVPIEVPEPARQRVCEYLDRVNWGMPLGNFELDFLSGEVRFRTSIAIENLPLTAQLVRPLAYANVFVVDQYLEDLAEVVAGTLDADTPDALRERGRPLDS